MAERLFEISSLACTRCRDLDQRLYLPRIGRVPTFRISMLLFAAYPASNLILLSFNTFTSSAGDLLRILLAKKFMAGLI